MMTWRDPLALLFGEPVPNVNGPGFAEEAHRQSHAVAMSHEAETDQAFVDSVSELPED